MEATEIISKLESIIKEQERRVECGLSNKRFACGYRKAVEDRKRIAGIVDGSKGK